MFYFILCNVMCATVCACVHMRVCVCLCSPFIYVKLFYTFAIMSSYLVQFYVAIEIIEPYVCQCVQKGRKPVVSYSLRAALVVGAGACDALFEMPRVNLAFFKIFFLSYGYLGSLDPKTKLCSC